MLLDFSPDGAGTVAFIVSLAIRWAGYAAFVAAAIYLGRRLGDRRIPLFAVAVLVLPELWSELSGNVVRELRMNGDIVEGYQYAVRGAALLGFVVRMALLAGILLISTRSISRGEPG